MCVATIAAVEFLPCGNTMNYWIGQHSVASIATQSSSSKMTDVWKNSGGYPLISVVSGI